MIDETSLVWILSLVYIFGISVVAILCFNFANRSVDNIYPEKIKHELDEEVEEYKNMYKHSYPKQ